MGMRRLAAMVATSACFLAGASGRGPVSAGESSPPAGPGQALAATKMVLEQPGTFFLTLRADVSRGPEARRLGYTVWAQGSLLKYPKGNAYDGVFDPYFVIEPDGTKGRFIFLLPIRLPAGESTVEVRSPEGGQVSDLRLRPELDSVKVSAECPGSVDGVYFPDEKPHAAVAFRGRAGTRLAGRAIVQLIRLADGDPDDFGPIEDRVVQAAKVGETPVALTLDDGGATWKKAVDKPKGGAVFMWSYDPVSDVFYAQTGSIFRYAR